jgi:hypothetical protein
VGGGARTTNFEKLVFVGKMGKIFLILWFFGVDFGARMWGYARNTRLMALFSYGAVCMVFGVHGFWIGLGGVACGGAGRRE